MTDVFQISRILGLSALAFAVAFLLTPILTHFLYKYRMGKQIRTEGAPIFAALHAKKAGTPTMGGILIWFTVLLLAAFFWLAAKFNPGSLLAKINFLTRPETLLPLGALLASAIVGLADDVLGVLQIGPKGGGLRVRHRLIVYMTIAAFGAWWFFTKLGRESIHIPFITGLAPGGTFDIGIWYIPIFVFILTATTHSANITDGLDGLAGGTLLTAFAAYGIIAYSAGLYNLSAFCGVIIGGLLAFLWFNVYPARFFMGDTGAMPLGITLGIIAMLTNQFLLLPLIAFIPMVESLSVIIQTVSKRFRHGKKIFISTPIHHHFEAIGWPETKITMRFWIISWMAAAVGLALAFLDKII